MINFFRRIRRKLADDNKPLKYMRYAIGEIVLVVIGILIALQVNNMNEQRKEQILEKKVLFEIRNALSSDIENQFNFHLSTCQKAIRSLDVINKHLSNNLTYHDSLSFHFSVIAWEAKKDWEFQSAAYESLKPRGVDLISSNNLKGAILNVYNQVYPSIVRDFYTYKNSVENYGRPILVNNFLLDDSMFKNEQFAMKLNPINYTTLIQNVQLINTIRFLRLGNMGHKALLTKNKKIVEEVIKSIDSELE